MNDRYAKMKAAFEKSQSNRGMSAIYEGDGHYKHGATQCEWENWQDAWQAATEAAKAAAQESAPAELPPLPKTVHVVRDGLGDIAFYAYSPEEMQAYGAACAAAALPRPVVSIPEGWNLVPSKITEAMHVAAVKAVIRSTGNDDCPPNVWRAMLAAAPASPQPVAKVLTESDIHAIIDSLPESAFEPTIAIGEITALFDDDNGEDEEVLEAIKAYAKIVAFRALAASTPTTLTEKGE